MKLHHLKQKIRGWLPQQPTNTSSNLRHYSVPIAIGIVLAISISLFVVAETLLISPAAVKPMPINEDDSNSTNTTAPPTPTSSPSPTPMPTSSSTTKEQAITIATPIVQQYANEHGRVIKSIDATLGYCTEDCWVVQADFEWSGIPSMVPIYNENGTITGYKWPDNVTSDSWIFGYDVAVGIRNGTIHDMGVQGVM